MHGYAGVTLAAGICAFIGAVIWSGPAIAIIGLLVITAGILALLQREATGFAVGPLLIVLGALAALASVGGISTDGTQFGKFDVETGQAFAVAAGAIAVAGYALLRWSHAEPAWLPIPVAILGVLTAGLAFGMAGALANPIDLSAWLAGIPAALAVAGMGWMAYGPEGTERMK